MFAYASCAGASKYHFTSINQFKFIVMLQIINYSEKAVAVIGDTKETKEQLKSMGGRFNPNLRKNEVNSKKNERGFVDETGSRRYTMTIDDLESIYKKLEDFVADCTKEECDENRGAINIVFSLIHKHIKTASHENEHNH